MPLLVVLLLVIIGIGLVLAVAWLAATFATLPLLGLAQAVAHTSETSELRLAATLSWIFLIASGVLLGVLLWRHLLAAFTDLRRGKYAGYLAYFLVMSLLVAGVLGALLSLHADVALYALNQFGGLLVVTGPLMLAPVLWWLFRRYLLRRTW